MSDTASPRMPIAAAIAVVVRGEKLLLVRRSHKPDAGRWGFPGGRIEPGETVLTAALRELDEETGVAADAVEVLTAIDVIRREREALHHFVLIAVLCRWRGGDGVPASDAHETGWFDLAAIAALEKSADVERVARLAMERMR
jgi:ADP-ribose pyrophosphatase YjhB (NUDIX family)